MARGTGSSCRAEEMASGYTGEVRLEIQRGFLTERVVRHWNREVAEWWRWNLGMWFSGEHSSAGLTLDSVILKGFSNPTNSMTLCFTAPAPTSNQPTLFGCWEGASTSLSSPT